MPNKMTGLLQDPTFMLGAGILANNTGHYGAFGPAFGKGAQQAGLMQRQNQTAQSNMDYRNAQMAQMPGDAAYKAAMAHRAMNPTKSTSEAERLINQIQSNPNDPRVPQWKTRLAKINAPSSSLVNFNYGTPSNPTTTRLSVTEDLVKSNPNINLSRLTDKKGDEAISIIDSEISAIQKQFSGRKQPVPSSPEVLNMLLKDPESATRKHLDNPDNFDAYEKHAPDWVKGLFGSGPEETSPEVPKVNDLEERMKKY